MQTYQKHYPYQKHYLTAKVATDLFNLNPQLLSEQQRLQVDRLVKRVSHIQNAILHSREAEQIEVTPQEVESAFAQCVAGYASVDEFHIALHRQHLDESQLKQALSHEIACEKVMSFISQDVPVLDKDKALAYFHDHQQEFSRNSSWEMSQILITINEQFVENHRPAALQRIREVKEQCDVSAFETLALKYSECPSALSNGYLGWCEEGKLYPQVVSALQILPTEMVSSPVETELGFHLVRYHQHRPARIATFEEAYPFLQQKHEQRARQYLQKQWLRQLMVMSS
ncbi:peptidylprolyl isomerase [Vibrio mangrovi]|uniref:peptidylprolyl isomerase n=1 Tax=Vibrio mangrovi TaxID=474394 RepID=A0A1Y6IQ78_9VIBR|nr:peptidylprolyl isomerase [Vibrio mangrovi]MDW6003982.1 peptidylprolyl isomerase [Vibrio mangrovi]SMR99221.1 peptidylprolyl isomerase [Vibrio mangrovi]